jgi:hypothetical protein
MSRKLIAVATTLIAGGVAAFVVASSSSTASETPRAYSQLTIDLGHRPGTTVLAKPAPGGSKRARVVYLQGAPTTINPADEPAGLSPYVDIKLTGCSRVIDGGIVPTDTTNVYLQGSYVRNSRQYHVLIALDDAAAAESPRAPFTITSNLTCLKHVK